MSTSNIELIAEIGQAHDGSLGIAHSYIDALADTGIHTIKFQTHIAHAESSREEPFRVNFSFEDPTRYDYWKRMEFTKDQWIGLKKHCEEVGLEFLSSPFSIAAVDLLEEIGVKRYKIGSGEVSNYLMLDKIAKTGKPIIMSSGMSSLQEISAVLNFLKPKNSSLTLLQCTTAYPTKPDQWGLNNIQEFQETFGIPVGFSDHSGNIFACLAAATLGAAILEFHAVFDKRKFGPDSKASLTIDQIAALAEGVKQIENALESPVKKEIKESTSGLKKMFEKSLAVNKDLEAGHVLLIEDLETKKPKGFGIDASKFREVVGKKLVKSISAWSFLTEDYFI